MAERIKQLQRKTLELFSVLVIVVGACPMSRHRVALLFNFASCTTFYKKREVESSRENQSMDGNKGGLT